MKIDDDVGALRSQLDMLEQGPAKLGDWHRLDARAARTLIHAQHRIAALQQELIGFVRAEPPDPAWVGKQREAQRIRELMAELCIIRLCAESRILECEAERNQSGFSNWVSGAAAR